MKSLVIAAIAFSSMIASATPGDIACKGLAKGQIVELLLGYDVHGQEKPSLIEISTGGKVVFSSTEVESSMKNIGTAKDPFINTVYTASDEESTATVRVPEQEPSDEFTVILTVLTDSGLFRVEELEMTCQR